MRYVYLLQSVSNPNQRYVGASADFKRRLKEHNAGQSPHTAKFRPWKPVVVIRLENETEDQGFAIVNWYGWTRLAVAVIIAADYNYFTFATVEERRQ